MTQPERDVQINISAIPVAGVGGLGLVAIAALVAVVLPAVGAWPGGPRLRPTTRVTAPGVVSLDPFPFTAPVTVEVEHVVIPDQEWSRAAVLREVRRTHTTATTWRLVPAASGEGRS